jgi:UDP-N-acetylmuramoylalanine--D-glutamate ligase
VERSAVLAAFERHAPTVPVFEVDTAETSDVMRDAVRLSAAAASEGDTVLLAPAAASMDQFTDYGDRGRRFAAAVAEHAGLELAQQEQAGGTRDDEPVDPAPSDSEADPGS